MLTGVSLRAGDETWDDGWAHDRVILAEGGFYANEIPFHHGAEGEDVRELCLGDQLDRLALVEA